MAADGALLNCNRNKSCPVFGAGKNADFAMRIINENATTGKAVLWRNALL